MRRRATDACAVPRCRATDREGTYYGQALCVKHWEHLLGDDLGRAARIRASLGMSLREHSPGLYEVCEARRAP